MATDSLPPQPASCERSFDARRLRGEFPQLSARVHDRPLVYLDNAATTQKPLAVLGAMDRHYRSSCSNIHRGVHELSARATAEYEAAREEVRSFLGAASSDEIVFTHGTTESINLVAHSWGGRHLKPGDEIVISVMEHHSNIVPWQLLAERSGARLRAIGMTDLGELDGASIEECIGPRTRLVAVAHMSNVLGTRHPLETIIARARAVGAVTVVDGAQAVSHEPIDVQALGCDFYAFSGHKVYGPTGIGVLYGRAERLAEMPPFLGGGDMIRRVTLERTSYADPPRRFEAGTPAIAEAIGLGAALHWLREQGVERVAGHERTLMQSVLQRLAGVPRLRRIGAPRIPGPVVSFVIEGIHPHDAATVLDHEGIAVRAGHHCAQPLMARLGLPATVRASLGAYNVEEDVAALEAGVRRAIEVLG
jgi:cysteine desulfurase/selenocysteine lyase